MIILGAIANGIAAAGGGIAGMLFKSKISSELGDFLMSGLGLVVILVSIQGMLGGDVTVAVISLVIGGLIGYAINIDGLIHAFGDWVQNQLNVRFAGSGRFANFSEGFIDASLFICVGAMAILGSLQSGLLLDHTTLFTKSLIDMAFCMVMATTLGIGVPFSGVVVFTYESLLSLAASLIAPYLTDVVITQTVCVGSLLLLAIGLNMLKITDIKAANFLPAAFLPIIFYLIM